LVFIFHAYFFFLELVCYHLIHSLYNSVGSFCLIMNRILPHVLFCSNTKFWIIISVEHCQTVWMCQHCFHKLYITNVW
jgi:hypothetical protein